MKDSPMNTILIFTQLDCRTVSLMETVRFHKYGNYLNVAQPAIGTCRCCICLFVGFCLFVCLFFLSFFFHKIHLADPL